MKQIITYYRFILFLSVTIPAFSQTGFRTEKGSIIWEHTYSDAASIKDLIESRDKMKLTSSDGTVFKGKAEGIKSTIEGDSHRLSSDANFEFTVTKSDGGYKVRITNYVFLEKVGPLQMRVMPGSIDKYYLDYGKIRNSEKTKTDLAYLDEFLTGLFVKQAEEIPVVAVMPPVNSSSPSGK